MPIQADQLIAKLQESKEEGVVIFKNSLTNSRYALRNGKDCIFLNGEYATNLEAEIRELVEEINAGNPHIYLDNDKLIIAKVELDPIEAMRRKIIAEFVAEQADIVAGKADYGTSTQGALNVASSADVGVAAAGSTSVDTQAAGTAKIVVGSKS